MGQPRWRQYRLLGCGQLRPGEVAAFGSGRLFCPLCQRAVPAKHRKFFLHQEFFPPYKKGALGALSGKSILFPSFLGIIGGSRAVPPSCSSENKAGPQIRGADQEESHERAGDRWQPVAGALIKGAVPAH